MQNEFSIFGVEFKLSSLHILVKFEVKPDTAVPQSKNKTRKKTLKNGVLLLTSVFMRHMEYGSQKMRTKVRITEAGTKSLILSR